MFIKKLPDHPEAKSTYLKIGDLFVKQLEHEKAANYLAQFGLKYPQEKGAEEALAKSCRLLQSFAPTKSFKICSTFAAAYPASSSSVIENLIIDAERFKQYEKMESLIHNYYLSKYKLSANQKILAHRRIYKAGKGKTAQSARAEQEIIAAYNGDKDNVSGEALQYIGELSFRPVPGAIEKYESVTLAGGTIEQLLASIQQKLTVLQQTEEVLLQVLATKDPYWGVAALFQLGLINEKYAEALENPPSVEGVPDSDLKKELAPQALERKKAALQHYDSAFEAIRQYKIYNEWSTKIAVARARLNGRRFEFDDFVINPDFLVTLIPQRPEASAKDKAAEKFSPIIYGFNGGRWTSHPHSEEKALEKANKLAESLTSPTHRNKTALMTLLGYQSLAGVPLEDALATARTLSLLEMKSSPKNDLPDISHLHLALAAYNVQKLAMTEYYTEKLIHDSTSKELQATAHILRGMMAKSEGRISEAMESWGAALKLQPDSPAALLNMGFLALRYGDFQTAKEHLSRLKNDWYAAYGLLVAARLEGSSIDTARLCSSMLSKDRKYPPAVFSCALHEYQSRQNYQRATALLNSVLRAKDAIDPLNEKAQQILDKIATEKKQKQKQTVKTQLAH
jgi:hypothetical protein